MYEGQFSKNSEPPPLPPPAVLPEVAGVDPDAPLSLSESLPQAARSRRQRHAGGAERACPNEQLAAAQGATSGEERVRTSGGHVCLLLLVDVFMSVGMYETFEDGM